MDDNSDSSDDRKTFQESEISIPRHVRFWLFLLSDIPCILCSFFLLYHLFLNKTLRNQLTNHIIIVLLIIGLIILLLNIPLHLTFLHFNIVLPSTESTCLFWWFMDLGLYNGCTIIMAWGSIERYLIIFYDRLFINEKKRIVFHYSSLIILLLYIFIFYIIVIVFPPCINTYNYELPVCNDFPCYLSDPILGVLDSVLNSIVPTVIICVCSLMILIRVWYQKVRLRRRNLWRKQRKMTIQLLCSSILYLIPNVPLNLLVFAHLCGLPDDVGVGVQLYSDFLCYFVVLLFPFLCLSFLPDLRKKIKCQRLLLLRERQRLAIVKPR